MRWQDGYPCDSGSTNGQDSARLAGLMQVFDHPQKLNSKLINYYDYGLTYLRHPKEINATAFSRDQASCLFAGLYVSGLKVFVLADYQPENDLISPSVRGHFKRCAGLKSNWFQDLWLWLDVLWSCFIAPMDEPNQLLAMMMIHPNKAYLKFWTKYNEYWRNSLQNYWYMNEGSWRQEKELCEHIISEIEKSI